MVQIVKDSEGLYWLKVREGDADGRLHVSLAFTRLALERSVAGR